MLSIRRNELLHDGPDASTPVAADRSTVSDCSGSPGQTDGVVFATDDAGQPIGAAWWHLHSPPLVRDAGGQAAPEVVMAVLEIARGRGVGAALIEALVQEPSKRSVSALALNVHLANPAARLYMRTGFRVAGAG
jgi:GNAT superfamily N-acetyltransferase